GNGSAFDFRQLWTNEVVRKVVQLLIGQCLGGQCQLKNGNARCIVGKYLRWSDAGRQSFEHGLSDRRDLRQRTIDVDFRVEKYFDHANTGKRLRLDVVDVVDGRGHLPLEIGN